MMLHTRPVPLLVMSLFVLTQCASKRNDPWQDIDYSKVYKRVQENDASYRPPSIMGCMDDDLINCR